MGMGVVILEGRVVMSLQQCSAIGTPHGSSLHCEASILTAAEMEGEKGRRVKNNLTQMVESIFSSTLSALKYFSLT